MSNRERLDRLYSICNIDVYREFDKRRIILKATSNKIDIPVDEVSTSIGEKTIIEIVSILDSLKDSDAIISLELRDKLGRVDICVSIDISGEAARLINYLTCTEKGLDIPDNYVFDIYKSTLLVGVLSSARQYLLKTLSDIQK